MSTIFYMPKRKRSGGGQGSRKKQKTKDGSVRAYSGSLVPAASRGYKPNPDELKVIDTDYAVYTVNSSASITLLNLCALGSDMTNRIGRKYINKSIYVRGYCSTIPAAAANKTNTQCIGQLARCILFVDYQPNGASPNSTDVLKEANSGSQLNLNNRDRFRILWDKTYALGPYVVDTTATQSIMGTCQQVAVVKKFKKINVETIYNSTNAGTIADINSGAIYMMWIGNVSGSTLSSAARVSVRVRFSDS